MNYAIRNKTNNRAADMRKVHIKTDLVNLA